MTGRNQFWKGMLLGAIAGGALSLLDKPTRQAMKENVQRVSGKAAYLVRNPGEITDKVKGTASLIKTTIEEVSEEIAYIVDKVDDLRELTPKVTDALMETKEAFSKSDEADVIEGLFDEKE